MVALYTKVLSGERKIAYVAIHTPTKILQTPKLSKMLLIEDLQLIMITPLHLPNLESLFPELQP